MGPRVVTNEQIRSFHARGFVLIPDLLTAEDVDRYAEAVDAAVADRQSHDPRRVDEKTRYERSFTQCLNLWEDRPDVRPLTFHERIGEAAARLLDVDAVRVWHDQALYKQPGGRVTDPHQDQPYWAISEPKTITAWIPLQDVSLENGAVGYLPGSHTSGLRCLADIFTGRGLDLEAHEETRGREFEFLEVPAGAVVFHHGLTVHRANPNQTEGTRRVHTIIYFADGCTRSDRPHPCVDRPGIAVGAPIASTLTPIAWPRASDALPTPPDPPDPPTPGWAGFRPDPEVFLAAVERLRAVERD